MGSLVSIQDLTDDDLLRVFDLAGRLSDAGGNDPSDNIAIANAYLAGLSASGSPFRADRIMATLFFEPSTRTRLSFEAAMHRLGGRVLGFSDARTSSVIKGETLADTIRIVNGYADVIVIRHPQEGSALVASRFSSVPIINAGDGGREHPTQCLLDLYTIRSELGRIEGLKIGLCGDLRYGRTVHSLAQGLARLGALPICIAPQSLRMPEPILDFVESTIGVRPREVERPEEVLPELDALYVTRIQQERFDDPADYEALRGVYVVGPELMSLASDRCIVLHPLPRVDEISPEFDRDPRAAYFRQGHNGVPVRMALVCLLFAGLTCGGPGASEMRPEADAAGTRTCDNPRCVTRTERYLAQRFEPSPGGGSRCDYCGARPAQQELLLG
jgi:aspartate carbamoyltransferase catalytic subunit